MTSRTHEVLATFSATRNVGERLTVQTSPSSDGRFLGTRRFGCTKIGATGGCLGGAQHATTHTVNKLNWYSSSGTESVLCNRITLCSVEGHEGFLSTSESEQPNARPMGDKPLRDLCRRELGQRSLWELGRAYNSVQNTEYTWRNCGIPAELWCRTPCVTDPGCSNPATCTRHAHRHRKLIVGDSGTLITSKVTPYV